MGRGLVVSDLHLFSRRSEGSKLLTTLKEELDQADLLVLNGDTFDFRWSCLPSEEATITAALEWITQLLNRFQGRPIHYVLGNHDCLTDFTTRLEILAGDHPALKCHPYRLCLNQHLFLHGDCANRKMDGAALRRFRASWSRDPPRGPIRKALYHAVDATGLSHRFHASYFPTQRTVRKVAHHLNHVMPAWRNEIEHCYFGHTHQPFSNHSHEGVQFHNTGSGIRGMGFQPLTFDAGPMGT
jgi:UDP-2,3-diacylglucosamine pyrophosphatase LpxH